MGSLLDDFEKHPQDYLSELVQVIRQGNYGLVFPDVEMISAPTDGASRVLRTHVMDKFRTCKTREDYCVASIHYPYQIYGLFRRQLLTDAIRSTRGFRTSVNFDVLLVQVVSVKTSISYVPRATKVYRVHEGSVSGTIEPRARLGALLSISWLCTRFTKLGAAKVPIKHPS